MSTRSRTLFQRRLLAFVHLHRLLPRRVVDEARALDVSPRELTDWFRVACTDDHDWVGEPNVLAMGSFGVGPLLKTRPCASLRKRSAAQRQRDRRICDHARAMLAAGGRLTPAALEREVAP